MRRRMTLEPLEARLALASQYLFGAEIYTSSDLATPGLVGKYFNRSLESAVAEWDWRSSQPIAGSRVDPSVEFLTNGWGARATVGLTHGSDANWDNFSVQWDGYLKVTEANHRFAFTSDDGSRMWIDLNRSGSFEAEEMFDNLFDYTNWWAKTGERTNGVAAGVYAIRIQYYDIGGLNTATLASTTYSPRQFVATATNPIQVVKALVLNFDPTVPSEGNRHLYEIFPWWSNPRKLAKQYEVDVEWATGGAVDIQIVEWRDLDEIPIFTNGFRYNADNYVVNRRSGSGWTDGVADFSQIARDQNLVPLVNSGAIDELWFFGDHYFNLLGEAWMAGPQSFFVNGPVIEDVGFNRAIAGFGFNYERTVAEMLHNLGHRIENHGQRAYGSWNLVKPASVWDQFSANKSVTASEPYGVGNVHFPANAQGNYDYTNAGIVKSSAFDFVNYPNLTGQTQDVSRDTWGLGPVPDYHRDYLNWYLAMMPRNDATASDGRTANWFKYIWDFNSYAPQTGLPRQQQGFGSGPTVEKSVGGDYEFTVRYYDADGIDQSTLGAGDVIVTGPNSISLQAQLVKIGPPTKTTAGQALTVIYRIVPPGGDWGVNDNGRYDINIQANQVRDIRGNAVGAGYAGRFQVQIPDPAVVNVYEMLQDGSASATHTQLDIGKIQDLFDGNMSSLVRTPNINPAIVTLAFNSPQSITGFRNQFSNAWGNPAYRYSIEAANNLGDPGL
jgi:PA14 domain